MKRLIILSFLFLMGCGREITGLQGPQGAPGKDALINGNTITEVIDPCGDAPGITDEVLLRLSDGSLLALYAANMNGDYPRLAVIGPGSYTTSDGSNCHLIVSFNGSVSW